MRRHIRMGQSTFSRSLRLGGNGWSQLFPIRSIWAALQLYQTTGGNSIGFKIYIAPRLAHLPRTHISFTPILRYESTVWILSHVFPDIPEVKATNILLVHMTLWNMTERPAT